MATMARWKAIRMYYSLVFVVLISNTGFSKVMPDKDTVRKWADSIDKKLEEMADQFTGYPNIENSYNKSKDPDVTFKEIKSQPLVQKMAVDLAKMLGGKMKALEDSVKVAEDAAAGHDFKPNLKLGNVNYWNAKDRKQLEPILEHHDRFGQPINATVSSVHIPVEIYEGDINILNGLKWSADLDKEFEKNYKKDDQILWQYFGSQTGFMRTFPASLWQTPSGEVDLYDVRRRPWYTQGSSSPKDMLILIDRSGSVHGKTLQLIKVAVKSILDTLGENDFVQIIKFSSKADYVSCFKTFVQANYRNKKILSEAVDEKLTANGMANFHAGLNFAFDQFEAFENSSKEGEGAHCNKMIMLLTDGGTDMAEEVFKKRNYNRKKDDRIRVFTYAVGQTANPVKDIRWMACANRGRFEEIPAMGAIRAKVQDYVEVVARPLALKHIELAKWTSSYTGSSRSLEYVPVLSRPQALKNLKIFKWGNIYSDRLGLGMMTTVTLPVYNSSKHASNQTILGVMGIDVTTAQMETYSPTWKLGPNGYTFAINTNGYVIFHPLLKIHGYLKDPPNMDLLDLEVEGPEMTELRKNMIDLKKSVAYIETYVLSPDERHVDKEKREYAYTSIDDTNFSLGLSLPSYQLLYAEIKYTFEKAKTIIRDAIKNKKAAILIAPWDYYKGMSDGMAQNLTGYIEDIVEAFSIKTNENDWDLERLYHLAWDLKSTKIYQQYVETAVPMLNRNDTDSNNTMEGLIATFLGTYGGATLVHPASQVELMMKYRDTWKALYYRRSLDMSKFLFSTAYKLHRSSNDSNNTNIMVAKAVGMRRLGKVYKPVVTGAFIQHSELLKILEQETVDSKKMGCADKDNVFCYLLDFGAFLIATNQEDKYPDIGRFFGHVDAGIMSVLYGTVYHRLEQYDYQATCPKSDDKSSSAPSLRFRIPSINLLFDLLTVNWWTSIWTWTTVNLNLYSWLGPPVAEAVDQSDDTVSCIKKQAQYYIHPNFTAKLVANTVYPCNTNCTRDYTAVRLDFSNLVLVVVGKECPGCVQTAKAENLIQEPVKDIGPDFCQMEPKYRKNPEPCYDYDEKEDTSACSGPLTHPVSAVLVVIATMVTIISTYICAEIAR